MTDWLSTQEGKLLLSFARKTIGYKLGENKNPEKEIEQQATHTILEKKCGTFVTLHVNGNLRGCIGNIEPEKTIFESVKDNAGYAAFKDSRFTPVSKNEFDTIDIEISILTPPKQLEYADGEQLVKIIKPNIDGVILSKGYKKATFLPQVWEQLGTPEQFLSRLCQKAGLSEDEWKTGSLDVFVYQVQMFEEDVK